MIQTQTEVVIKDNSGFLKGRVINVTHKTRNSVGQAVKVALTKLRSKSHNVRKKTPGSKLLDLLVIQTKKPMLRYDGSSMCFNENTGVSVAITNDSKLVLGFKRITTSVVFEIKKINTQQRFKGSYNLIKLAKNLL